MARSRRLRALSPTSMSFDWATVMKAVTCCSAFTALDRRYVSRLQVLPVTEAIAWNAH